MGTLPEGWSGVTHERRVEVWKSAAESIAPKRQKSEDDSTRFNPETSTCFEQ